jgi:cytochrome c oxidase subunit IV
MAQHLVPRRTYYQVFAILLGLTGITVAVAFLNLGPLNTIVALAIAVLKALLVVLIFMHVRYSSRLTGVVVAGGVFWLLLLMALTMSDYLTRSWLPVVGW